MKKRVMIQDGDGYDPETGEQKWEDATGDEDTTDEKIYIGRVRLTDSSLMIGIMTDRTMVKNN